MRLCRACKARFLNLSKVPLHFLCRDNIIWAVAVSPEIVVFPHSCPGSVTLCCLPLLQWIQHRFLPVQLVSLGSSWRVLKRSALVQGDLRASFRVDGVSSYLRRRALWFAHLCLSMSLSFSFCPYCLTMQGHATTGKTLKVFWRSIGNHIQPIHL